MVYGKKQLILTFVCAALAGSGLHFLYSLAPNPVTAVFSPVNESLWEHLKIFYWPYLAAIFLLCRGRPTGSRPWLLTLCGMCGFMLLLGYWYHILLGGTSLVFDIGLFILLMGLGFLIPSWFSGPFRSWKWEIPLIAIAALGGMLVLFTFFPPQGMLFTDLSGANTWYLPNC